MLDPKTRHDFQQDLHMHSQPNSATSIKKKKAKLQLDLRATVTDEDIYETQRYEVEMLLKLLHTKKKIVVIAGAGISVGSGGNMQYPEHDAILLIEKVVPDFRSSEGLFTTLRTAKTSGKELFDASVYKNDKLTTLFHSMVRELHALTSKAEPTEFHHLLATLAKDGRLLRLYTQNVDCIDTRMEPLKTRVPLPGKGPWPKSVQLHGGLDYENCSKCGWIGPFEPEIFVGPEPPDCQECIEMESVRGIAGKRCLGVGKLRPRIVLYNEYNPDSEPIGTITSADLKSRPDAVIVVGTSLKVPGVRRIVREMCSSVGDYRGGLSVWMNADDQPCGKDIESLFDLIVRGDCERVARLANMPHWDSGLFDEHAIAQSNLLPQLSKSDLVTDNIIEVQIPQLGTPFMRPRTIPTPLDSKEGFDESGIDDGEIQPARPARHHTIGANIPPVQANRPKKICKNTNAKMKFPSKPARVHSVTVKKTFKAVKKFTIVATKSNLRPKIIQNEKIPPTTTCGGLISPCSTSNHRTLVRSNCMDINNLLN